MRLLTCECLLNALINNKLAQFNFKLTITVSLQKISVGDDDDDDASKSHQTRRKIRSPYTNAIGAPVTSVDRGDQGLSGEPLGDLIRPELTS